MSIVLLLASCTAAETVTPKTAAITPTALPLPIATPEREAMASYIKYFNSSNSDYISPYENSGAYDGNSWGYVGNRSDLIGFYLAFKLPADFPKQGSMIDDYRVDSDEITGAQLRIVEVSKGTRGSGTLNMKVSPIYGAWNHDAKFNSLPTWDSSVVANYSAFGAAPSLSHYDTGYGYHPAKYYYNKYSSVYFEYYGVVGVTTYKGTYFETDGYEYYYDHTTPAYYDYYYQWGHVDITNVAKECVKNGATGLLLWFDTSSTSYNRKALTTNLETADTRRPGIAITFGAGTNDLKVKQIGADGAWHALKGLKQIGADGEWHTLKGLKQVVEVDGTKQWVRLY